MKKNVCEGSGSKSFSVSTALGPFEKNTNIFSGIAVPHYPGQSPSARPPSLAQLNPSPTRSLVAYVSARTFCRMGAARLPAYRCCIACCNRSPYPLHFYYHRSPFTHSGTYDRGDCRSGSAKTMTRTSQPIKHNRKLYVGSYEIRLSITQRY